MVIDLCKVNFPIGKKFSCEVLCNIMEMDICHLILGRLWQFDMADEQMLTFW